MQAEAKRLHETTSLCSVCKNAIPAQVVAREDGEVWMLKACPSHGRQDVRISTDAGWYEETRAVKPVLKAPQHLKKDVEHGCPFDCGPCESHEQKIRLPVVTITSACNLDCPICYVHNKNEDAFHMGPAEFEKILGHLVADHGGELDIVNFTGGEPTMHPHFLDFLEMSKKAGIHRVTICSNGIKLARDEEMVKRLAELGGRVALSFDTFDEKADFDMQGAHLVATKMRALELLEKHNVDTTLIPVMTRGVNDHEIGRIIEMALGLKCVRHMEIHTITYTGQGGVSYDPERKGRISMLEVLQRIEETTNGMMKVADFVPSPCAHPLCYQVAYLLMDPAGGRPVPFSRVIGRESFYDSLSDRLYMEPTPKLERAMQLAIDRLWAEGGAEADRTLAILRSLLDRMFPAGRKITRTEALAIGEQSSKAIYVHSHMDEETFDNDRIVQCCDSNCYADGTTIPVCAYNVLYREKEEHFMTTPKEWNERSGGQKSFPKSLRVIRG